MNRPFIAALGLAFWPLWLLADTVVAIGRGWSLDMAGMFRIIPIASVIGVATILLSLCIPYFRRMLGTRWRQCWMLAGSLPVAYLLSGFVIHEFCPQPEFHCRLSRVDYQFEPNSASLSGVSGLAHSRFNSAGLRGPEFSSDGQRFHFLCIGGSTTEGLYLDDTETWPGRLMAELNGPDQSDVWVAATAGGDLATGHHLRFIRTATMVEHAECLIVMPGANDLVRFVLGISNSDSPPPIWFESAIVEVSKQLWNARLGHGFVWDRTGDGLARRQSDRPIPAHSRVPDLQRELRDYRSRLESIVREAKSAKRRLVFVTHPVLWDDFLTLPAYRLLRFARMLPEPRDWEYLRPGNLREVMDQFNDVLSEVCQKQQIELVDAASSLNGQSQYFYDDYHLNEAGSAALAKLLAIWFEQHPPVVASSLRTARRGVSVD